MVKRKKKSTVSLRTCECDSQKLPLLLKEKFGQLGFVKWTCSYSPVLIVDPMKMVLEKRITEGIYHAWAYKVHLYHNQTKEKTNDTANEGKDHAKEGRMMISSLPVLIYWLGTTYEFSILQLAKVLDWEAGCELGYDKLPSFMEKRISPLERPIPAVYSLIHDAMEMLDKIWDLSPEDRSLAVVTRRHRNSCILNEWHALAMEDPPHYESWKEQKDLLQEKLPNSHWFGKLAFLPKKIGGKKYHHPVLVLGPFRAPPGPTRTEWFNKCSSGKMVMVYWLGSYTSGRLQQNVFTFHNLKELVDYETGKKKKYDVIDAKYLKDYDDIDLSAKRLSSIDLLVCSRWELQEALKRKPEDRWGGLEDFEEDHDDDFDYYWECINAAQEASRSQNGSCILQNEVQHQVSDTADDSSSFEEEHGIFDDASSDESDFLPARHLPSRNKKRQTSTRKKTLVATKSISDGSSYEPQATKSIYIESRFAPSARVPLRQEESAISTDKPLVLPAAVHSASENHSASDQEIDDRIESSILDCAAFLNQETIVTKKKQKKRKASRLSDSPHTTTMSSSPASQLNCFAVEPSENISKLKRRKYQTESKVRDVIKQWSKKSSNGDDAKIAAVSDGIRQN